VRGRRMPVLLAMRQAGVLLHAQGKRLQQLIMLGPETLIATSLDVHEGLHRRFPTLLK